MSGRKEVFETQDVVERAPSDSEGSPLSRYHIGQVEPKLGRGSSSLCSKRGSVYLVSRDGEFAFLNVNCKTWRCISCRDRMKNLFRMRVTVGCSSLGPCAFMTFTYQAESPRLADARCVEKDWKALWRKIYRDPQLSALKWLRVMEVTRKMVPHYHVVLGPLRSYLTSEVRCYGDKLYIRRYNQRFDSCACLSHRFARAWYEVTGDSYIVQATPVIPGKDAGGYMAKYLTKTFGAEGRMKALGMKRRWSSSRGWPGSGRPRLRPSVEKNWEHREYKKGGLHQDWEEQCDIERVGSLLVIQKSEEAAEEAVIRKMVRYVR